MVWCIGVWLILVCVMRLVLLSVVFGFKCIVMMLCWISVYVCLVRLVGDVVGWLCVMLVSVFMWVVVVGLEGV